MRRKTVLITGVTGQDGSYLAEFLLSCGYKVCGFERRSSQKQRNNLESVLDRVEFISGDLCDESSLVHALRETNPAEVYNLASQSFVGESWCQPVYTGDVGGLGALRMLEAVRQVNPKIKFFQASSSEMFGAVEETSQNESTRFYPRSPYGVAKLYAHWITVNYRESYGIFAVSGISFNHESPRRGLEFVTRKITHTAAKIKLGLAGELKLGDLSAKRDWGFAGDYVEAMHLMLQQKKPRDYVIATGKTHSVKEFADAAFAYLGLDWKDYVKEDKNLIRPAEVYNLCGDAKRIKMELGWQPKVAFNELVKMMVEADLKALRRDQMR